MSRTASNMQKLINRKYYATAEEALNILDAFLMANRVTMEEYTDLAALVEEQYAEPVVEETPAEEPVVE